MRQARSELIVKRHYDKQGELSAAGKTSPAWLAQCARLQHLAAMEVQFDGQRVQLPRIYLDVLREQMQQNNSCWLLAYSGPGVLVLVPEFLWEEYIENLSAELQAQNRYSPRSFRYLFIDPHRKATMDSRGRLLIPVDIFPMLKENAADQREPSALVLRPERAYLELLSKSIYENMRKVAREFMAPYFAYRNSIAAHLPPQIPRGTSADTSHTNQNEISGLDFEDQHKKAGRYE